MQEKKVNDDMHDCDYYDKIKRNEFVLLRDERDMVLHINQGDTRRFLLMV